MPPLLHRSIRTAVASGMLLALSLLGGCATTDPQDTSLLEAGPGARVTSDGLRAVRGVQDAMLFVEPNHQIATYSRFLVEPVTLVYKKESPRFSERSEERIKTYMRDSMIQAVENAATVTNAPDDCTLRVNIELIDFQLQKGTGFTGSKTTYARSLGSVKIVMTISQSLSKKPLLRFMTKRSIGGGQYIESDEPRWGRLRRLFDTFNRDLGRETARAIPATTGPPREQVCDDPIQREDFNPDLPPRTSVVEPPVE